MKTLQDLILYVEDFAALVAYLDTNHPEMLMRDEDGSMLMPPVVTGFARTPAVVGPDGNSLMVYARLREHEVTQWQNIPQVEVLAQSAYAGKGTGETVYNIVFNDPDKLALYDSVYDRTPYDVTDDEGQTITITPPDMFGMMAGA